MVLGSIASARYGDPLMLTAGEAFRVLVRLLRDDDPVE
jgi:hypothetical protein